MHHLKRLEDIEHVSSRAQALTIAEAYNDPSATQREALVSPATIRQSALLVASGFDPNAVSIGLMKATSHVLYEPIDSGRGYRLTSDRGVVIERPGG